MGSELLFGLSIQQQRPAHDYFFSGFEAFEYHDEAIAVVSGLYFAGLETAVGAFDVNDPALAVLDEDRGNRQRNSLLSADAQTDLGQHARAQTFDALGQREIHLHAARLR